MIAGLLQIVNQILTFYIPTFYTFRFLMNNNVPKIRTVLKFWTVLSIYHILQWLLSHIIAQNIFPVIDLVVLVGLNWKEMEYAELIYNTTIGPAFINNRESIQKISKNVQNLFNQKTKGIKQKVADSTSQKLKGFIGQILVGAMNPNIKRKDSSNDQSQSHEENDEQKEE